MIRQLAIIGSGTMGRGIAYLSAVAGYETVIHDVDAGALDAAKASVESMLKKGVEKGKVEAAPGAEAGKRIHVSNDLGPAGRGAELNVGPAPEGGDLQERLFPAAGIV